MTLDNSLGNHNGRNSILPVRGGGKFTVQRAHCRGIPPTTLRAHRQNKLASYEDETPLRRGLFFSFNFTHLHTDIRISMWYYCRVHSNTTHRRSETTSARNLLAFQIGRSKGIHGLQGYLPVHSPNPRPHSEADYHRSPSYYHMTINTSDSQRHTNDPEIVF